MSRLSRTTAGVDSTTSSREFWPTTSKSLPARITYVTPSSLRQKIFHWAIGVGAEVFGHFVARTTPGPLLKLKFAIADRLAFSKIKERTGGRMRVFISGGAPLAREIGEALLPERVRERLLAATPQGGRTLFLAHGPLEALPLALIELDGRPLDERLTLLVLPGLPAAESSVLTTVATT